MKSFVSTFYTYMPVNGDKSKVKHNKTVFKVQVPAPTDKNSPSPPPSAHSSGLQVPGASTTRSPSTNTFRSRYMSMLSPRSSNYERLEGGMGPSRLSNTRRFGWKKFVTVACVFIGLVYLFGPRQNRWSSQLPG